MKKLLALLIGAASLLVTPAYADFTGKNAAAATVTFKNPNDCTSVVCVPIYAQYDATGANAVAVVTAGADGASNTANGALGYSRNLIFNGTTWDRWQGAVTNAGTFAVQLTGTTNTVQGTGASGAALAGNPFRVGLSDGTNSQNWLAAIALADGVNGNNTGSVASWLWNGATYDRARGDLTSGAWVNVKAALPAGTNTVGTVGQLPYPVGAVPLTASATGTTLATTATLAGAVGKTTYICSLSVRANATANTNVTDTVTGVITGTLSRALWVPANTAGLGVDEQIYSPCVPASGTNQAIAVVSGAPGTGGVVSVNATGYQL